MTRLRLVVTSGADNDSTPRVVAPLLCANDDPLVAAQPPRLDAAGAPEPLLAGLAALVGSFELLAGEARTSFLRELAFAVADLCSARRLRVVTLGGERREIGLERVGGDIVACVYRTGAEPEILLREGRMPAELVRTRLLELCARLAATEPATSEALLPGRLALEAASVLATSVRASEDVEIAAPRGRKLALSARLRLLREPAPTKSARARRSADVTSRVARADIHALLWRGELTAAVGESERRLDGAYVFLIAEQLVALAGAALEARAAHRPLVRRAGAGAHRCGITLDRLGRASLLLAALSASAAVSEGIEARVAGAAPPSGTLAGYRLPAIDASELVRSVAAFARALCRRLVAADCSLLANLRFVALQRDAGALARKLAGAAPAESRLNSAPESYRAFARTRAASETRAQAGPLVGRLRFSEMWRAEIASIDLRCVFVCGDRLVVGSSRELCAIERTSGTLVWQSPARRAASVLTPAGLGRIGADGALALVSLDDGSELFGLRLAPCAGASTSAAVVNAPGLPRMLLVGEGANELCAVDLDAGEVRWRRRVRRGRSLAPVRLRRAGKLVIVSAAEPDLCAFDVVTGEEVWRRVQARGFMTATTFDGGELFAVRASRPRGRAALELEHIDPWTGAVRWRTALPRAAELAGPPLVAGNTVLPTYDDGRIGIMGVRREDGALACDVFGGVCEAPAGWLVVDDAFVANSEQGELTALDAADGRIRYRHLLPPCARLGPGDRPENLRPVLRSGALFVPQAELYVIRPRDGAVLGSLEPNLVPDVTRVDERCGVYAAELSGHVAAFAALPTLQLVTPLASR